MENNTVKYETANWYKIYTNNELILGTYDKVQMAT